jgi:hypothetical protein
MRAGFFLDPSAIVESSCPQSFSRGAKSVNGMDFNGSPAPTHRKPIDGPSTREQPGQTNAPIPASDIGIQADDLVMLLTTRFQ